MRICLFGGSFDPIHRGHLAMVRAALEAGGQDQVLLLPAATPPHKKKLTDPGERLRMAELACETLPGASVSDHEIRRGGISYTVDTVRAFRREEASGTRWSWLIGSDSLVHFPQWRESANLLELCDLLIVPRTGFPVSLVDRLAQYSEAARERIRAGFLAVEPVDISSTQVRDRLAVGTDASDLLPAPVWQHILKRGLYGIGGAR